MSDPLLAASNVAHKHARRVASRGRRALKLSLEGVKDGWHAARRQVARARDACVNAAKDAFRRVRRPIRAASRHRSQMREQRQFYRTEWTIEHELEQLATRGRTLVVGPWLSEVGFEALYWVPFLHWLKSAFQIAPDRVVAVSRGGVAGWYQGVAGRYVEMWDHVDPAVFARRNAERGETKQLGSSDFEREILDRVARQIGARDFDVVHPGLMYRLFTLYWSGQRAMGFLDAHTRFTRMEAPAIVDPALLPREYVAVKFYAARSLPDTPVIRAQLKTMVASIAREIPVVLLDTGLVLEDDHADYAFDAAARVVSARPWMTPQNNLGVQTQIAAGAKAFVGTCGSLTWLVPRLGVDTSAVFVDPKWLHAHLPVAMRAAHKLDAGRFAAADLRALDPWSLSAARLEGRT